MLRIYITDPSQQVAVCPLFPSEAQPMANGFQWWGRQPPPLATDVTDTYIKKYRTNIKQIYNKCITNIYQIHNHSVFTVLEVLFVCIKVYSVFPLYSAHTKISKFHNIQV